MITNRFKKRGLARPLACFTLFAGVFVIGAALRAISQTNSSASALASTNLAKSPGTNSNARPARPPATKQAEVASTNAVFGAVTTNDVSYKSALDAHALDEAKKVIGTNGAFKGTVAKVFEPRGMAIVEFDQDYKTALTAIVHGTNFSKFPALTNLIGRDVLVTGRFIEYHGKAEIVLDKPEQIKLVK